ncbi:hypothetical protein [Streptomyces sp. SH5]|uniref:hypothetical protein n=1 Tax=Streptomyces sp. SH5 TaxID=3041765 RepID=UPI0024780B0E|nr:hypothetical protein [Streptomyces sp. SH5]WGP12375.1 hypothetical protein QFA72_23255 [Streptomyces sp. SH5]
MSMRHTTTGRRALAAAALAAVFGLALTGCGDDGGSDEAKQGGESSAKPSEPATSPTEEKGEQQPDTATGENVDPNAKLAEVRGDGLVMTIHQAKRDSGGFITLQASIKNEGTQSKNTTAWAGTETALLAKNPNSVAGATLVDKVGKKRYYILRDTENRCLCTTGIPPLLAGKTTSVFMQFPAPPETTTEVDFTLPTFATTSVKISG